MKKESKFSLSHKKIIDNKMIIILTNSQNLSTLKILRTFFWIQRSSKKPEKKKKKIKKKKRKRKNRKMKKKKRKKKISDQLSMIRRSRTGW